MRYNQNPGSFQVPEDVGIIADFFKEFRLGSLLNRSNITKTKGASPLTIFSLLFNLVFTGNNLFQGVVKSQTAAVGKDAVYHFLNNARYNWRKLNLLLSAKIYLFIKHLLDNANEEVLIFDDSTYSRNRSKKVELLSRVFDHSDRKYLKGFRLLTLGWSDGNSFLGIDFALLSSAEEKNRYQPVTKALDKRCCGFKRRQEAMTKSTQLLEPMVKRALCSGIKARYVVMDSWFSFPGTIACLRNHLHVICMLKDHPNWHYTYQGKKLRLSELYPKLKKRRGRSKIKASVMVTTSEGKKARIIFVPSDQKRGWLALLSTDLEIPGTEIIRKYGKRWDVEVFFKMAKQHLKLAKEIQIRDYDGLIAHTTIVMMRYNFLSYHQRISVDQRAWGDLFRLCLKEMDNLTFLDALKRILILAKDQISKTRDLSEKIILAMLDAVMGSALQLFGFKSPGNPLITNI